MTVQHEHGERRQLSRSIPAVAAVHHHRVPAGHFVCHLDRPRQHQLHRDRTASGGAGTQRRSVESGSHLDVFQPVCGLQAGQPVGLLHVGVDDVFKLLQGLPHDVDVLDVQEDQLCVLVFVPFIAPSCGLKREKQSAFVLIQFIIRHKFTTQKPSNDALMQIILTLI